MIEGSVAGQLGSFLADLRFLACLGALGLYGAWSSAQRPGLVGMARLGLVIAFGATVVAYALSGVPAGALHNFVNTGPNPLVLFTVYGPADHAPDAVHHTNEEADAAEESGEDEPPA